MMLHRLNSIEQAAKDSRLGTIEIAAKRAEYKAQGGKVEQVGTTRSITLTVKRQHSAAVMSGAQNG